MSQRITFTVAGEPKAQPRPRVRAVKVMTRKGPKWIGQAYHPTKVGKGKNAAKDRAWVEANAWREAVATAVRPHLPATPWTGPVCLTADVYLERPQRLCRRKDPDGPIRATCKPDRDNLDKAILDALTAAGLWEDDAQVCDGPVRKWYAAKGCGPGVIIVAEHLVEPQESLYA